MTTLVATIGEGLRLVKDCVVVQGGTSTIAEATPAAKASPRACREASANTNSRRAARLVMDTLSRERTEKRCFAQFLALS